MKPAIPMLVVSDLNRSKKFYAEVLNQTVTADYGANITFSGGFSLQTLDSWKIFVEQIPVFFGGCASELYFEEDDYDGFLQKLSACFGVQLVHLPKTHAWGQRVVRFYDPDLHIIEVGEPLSHAAARFAAEGMDADDIAVRMDIPTETVKALLKET